MKIRERVILGCFIIIVLFASVYIFYKSGEFNKFYATSKSNTQNDKIKIDYEITLENLISGKANVIIHMSNIKTPSIKIRELSYLPYSNPVSAFTITNSKGAKLNVSKIEPIKDDRKNMAPQWNVELKDSDSIIIKYSKTLRYTEKGNNSQRYLGYIGDGFACFIGGQLLLVPSDSKTIDPNIEVKIRAPKNANILVPWAKEGDIYYPNKNEDTSRFTHIAEALNYSTIVIGDYSIHNIDVGSTKVTVGLPNDYNSEDAAKLVKDIGSILQYYTNLFGESIGSVYQVALLKPPSDGKQIIGFEWTNNQTVMLQGKNVNLNRISHQMFHRWNAFWYGWKYSELGYLLKESIVRYYENKSIIVLVDKLNEIDYGSLSDLLQTYEKYKLIPEANRKIYDKAEDPFYTYDEGALLCLYLDIDIMNTTNNKKSLDDLLKLLWQNYGKQGKVIDKNVFLSTLKQLTEKDYGFFYDSYIGGNKYLKLDYLFDDYDKDGVPNYIETLEGTNLKDSNSYNESAKTKLTTIIYPHGEVYVGKIKDNKPDGIGKMTFLDGTIFEGNWVDGKKQGKGKLIYKNGEIQEGNWIDDKLKGEVH